MSPQTISSFDDHPEKSGQKHGMECLFTRSRSRHQRVGKHVNFSLGNGTEGNLLLPGDTPHENAQFFVFCAR